MFFIYIAADPNSVTNIGYSAFYNYNSIICLSKGSDEKHGVAESRKFWGSTLWEEYARNDDTTHTSF